MLLVLWKNCSEPSEGLIEIWNGLFLSLKNIACKDEINGKERNKKEEEKGKKIYPHAFYRLFMRLYIYQ